jgi:hypothetical protein
LPNYDPWSLLRDSFELKPCVREFGDPLVRMQTPEFADAAQAAFDATPEEMGAAAVKAADVDRDLKLIEKLASCGQTVKPHFRVHFCTCGRDGRPVTWRCEGTDPPRTYVQSR